MIDLNPFINLLKEYRMIVEHVPDNYYIEHGFILQNGNLCYINDTKIRQCIIRYNLKYRCYVLVEYSGGGYSNACVTPFYTTGWDFSKDEIYPPSYTREEHDNQPKQSLFTRVKIIGCTRNLGSGVLMMNKKDTESLVIKLKEYDRHTAFLVPAR